MSTAEVSKVAADQPSKLVKEKKTKAAPKVNKPKSAKTASHPPYFEMIKEALLALKEKGGSSPYAIAKYIEENQKVVLPANFRKILGLQLKNSAAKGKLIKVKASYKLSDSGKKEKKTAVAKPLAIVKKVEKAKKKTVAAAKGALKMKPKKVDSSAKKVKAGATPTKSVQKTKKRAAAPAKVKAKQPKSIKSPAAKKAKKGGA